MSSMFNTPADLRELLDKIRDLADPPNGYRELSLDEAIERLEEIVTICDSESEDKLKKEEK